MNSTEATKILKSRGYSVRLATNEEKLVPARAAKKEHCHRHYKNKCDRMIYDNFKKDCFVIYHGARYYGLCDAKTLIAIASGEHCNKLPKNHITKLRQSGRAIMAE